MLILSLAERKMEDQYHSHVCALTMDREAISFAQGWNGNSKPAYDQI